MKSASLRIRVLGPIWWPSGLTCAAEETLHENDFERCDIDPHNADDMRTYADTHFGDFSGIDAIDAVYQERRQCSECHTLTRAEHTRVLSFTDDEECAWVDAMYPAED